MHKVSLYKILKSTSYTKMKTMFLHCNDKLFNDV